MNLTEENKKQIAIAVKEYCENKAVSVNNLARLSGVNVSFVSQILANKGEVKDAWYVKLAEFIGYKLEKKFWHVVETAQFKEVIMHLEDARHDGKARVIIGETGCGKTFTVNKYLHANPNSVFKVTISGFHNLMDVINDMLDVLALPVAGTKVTKVKNIAAKLRQLRHEGRSPLIIVDECENAKINTLSMLKTLYDYLKDNCPVVLIGTSQLVRKIEKLKNRDKDGMPQFYRRFKGGIRRLTPVDLSFKHFLNDITDKRLIKLLQTTCNNYGELNDYLEFALKEADRLRQTLDYDLFIKIYNIKS